MFAAWVTFATSSAFASRGSIRPKFIAAKNKALKKIAGHWKTFTHHNKILTTTNNETVQILHWLASGYLGDVFVAKIISTNSSGRGSDHKKVIVKIEKPGLPTQLKSNFPVVDNALRAAEESAGTTLVKSRGVSFDIPGRPAHVMELLDGQTLDRHLKEKGKLDPLEAISHTKRALRAISALHETGSLHLDLHDENIILGPNGAVVIDASGISINNSKIFKEGLFPYEAYLGLLENNKISDGYIWDFHPPEQFNIDDKRDVAPHTDLYAVGGLLFALTTGLKPAFHVTSDKLDHLPAELRTFIKKARAIEPAERFQDASEMRQELERIEAVLQKPEPASAN